MGKHSSSVSRAGSYKEIGEFWDTHDLGDYWEQAKPVDFDVEIQSEATYYPVDATLSNRVRTVAKH